MQGMLVTTTSALVFYQKILFMVWTSNKYHMSMCHLNIKFYGNISDIFVADKFGIIHICAKLLLSISVFFCDNVIIHYDPDQ